MSSPWRERGLTSQEAAILFHPDRRTPWAPSLVVHLRARSTLPRPRRGSPRSLPSTRSSTRASSAIVGGPARADSRSRRPRIRSRSCGRGSISPPGRPCASRVLSAPARLVVVGHHAALDGRALLSVAAAVLGTPPGITAAPDQVPTAASAPAFEPGRSGSEPGRPARPGDAFRRVLRPADRVAPSAAPPTVESFAACELGPGAAVPRASTLAAASTVAVAQWNDERGARWERVGLTIPVGGPPVLGNVSTHRRVDVRLPADIAGAVTAALAQAVAPPGSGLGPGRARLLLHPRSAARPALRQPARLEPRPRGAARRQRDRVLPAGAREIRRGDRRVHPGRRGGDHHAPRARPHHAAGGSAPGADRRCAR